MGRTSFIYYVIYLLLFTVVLGYKVLLIGDSNDRFITREWHERNQRKYGFNEECIKWLDVEDIAHTHYFCRLGHHSIANVFLVGTNDEPPYFLGFGKDPAFYSKNLLPRSINAYFAKFGAPDRVYYHGCFWDIAEIYTSFNKLYPHGKLEDLSMYTQYGNME